MSTTPKKVTSLSAATSANSSALIYIVTNPSGTPVSNKLAIGDLFGNVTSNVVISTSTKFTIKGDTIFNPMARPSGPANGQIYYDTSDKHLYLYNGTAWKQLDN